MNRIQEFEVFGAKSLEYAFELARQQVDGWSYMDGVNGYNPWDSPHSVEITLVKITNTYHPRGDGYDDLTFHFRAVAS